MKRRDESVRDFLLRMIAERPHWIARQTPAQAAWERAFWGPDDWSAGEQKPLCPPGEKRDYFRQTYYQLWTKKTTIEVLLRALHSTGSSRNSSRPQPSATDSSESH